MISAERKLRLQIAGELERARNTEGASGKWVCSQARRAWVEAISIVLDEGGSGDGDDAQD